MGGLGLGPYECELLRVRVDILKGGDRLTECLS
jgi:hypothetical protein